MAISETQKHLYDTSVRRKLSDRRFLFFTLYCTATYKKWNLHVSVDEMCNGKNKTNGTFKLTQFHMHAANRMAYFPIKKTSECELQYYIYRKYIRFVYGWNLSSSSYLVAQFLITSCLKVFALVYSDFLNYNWQKISEICHSSCSTHSNE